MSKVKLMEYVYPVGADLSCVTVDRETVKLTVSLSRETLITFPLSSECSVYYDLDKDGGRRLRIYGEKNIDDYLPIEVFKHMRAIDREYELKKVKAEQEKVSGLQKRREQKEAALLTMRADILKLIESDPGKSRSYYERKSVSSGGVAGSQDRKEQVMQSLLAEGVISLIPYDKPVGRAKHFVRINQKAASD